MSSNRRSSSSGSRDERTSASQSKRGARTGASATPIKGKRKSIAAKTKKNKKQVELPEDIPSEELESGEQSSAGGVSERTKARRLGEVRAKERAKRNRRRYLIYILRIAAVIVGIVAIVFGAIFLYRSDAFSIENVKVTGVSHLTDQEISQLAAVPDDSTLLRLDTAGIIERLETHPWVESATIHRQIPDTIEIEITERTPAAAVYINEGSIWVISTDNTWLSAATEDDWNSMQRITDVSAAIEAPAAGNECSDEGVVNAIAIYAGVTDSFAQQIYSISAESAIKATLVLTNGVTVAFGEADEIDLKEAAVQSLLSQYEGTISYINVRTPSRPTYRTM